MKKVYSFTFSISTVFGNNIPELFDHENLTFIPKPSRTMYGEEEKNIKNKTIPNKVTTKP